VDNNLTVPTTSGMDSATPVQTPPVTPPAQPAEPGSKKMVWVLVGGAVVILLVVVGFYFFMSNQQQSVSEEASIAPVVESTPEPSIEEEVAGVNIEELDTYFAEIDKDLSGL